MNQLKVANSSKWKIAITRIHAWLYRKFPLLVPRPNMKELLASVRRSDADANINSEPPVDEEIRLQCLWVVEFYGPSHISNLLTSLSAPGWVADNSSRSQRCPASWLQERRTAPNATGWMNLGVIRRGTDTQPFEHGRHAGLPEGIEYAIADLYSLTSSVSCIVVGFVLDDSASKRMGEELRKKRKTDLRALKKPGHQIMGPMFQKQRDVAAFRTELRRMTSNWFRTHLPGLFASDDELDSHPAFEFLTLRVTDPFPEEESQQISNVTWLNCLGLHQSQEIWSSRTLNAIKLIWPLQGELTGQTQAIIVAREDLLLCEISEQEDGRSQESPIHYVDRVASTLFSRLGIVCMLNHYERYLNHCRDMMIPSRRSKATAIKVIEDVCSRLANGMDVSAMASELREFSGATGTFRFGLEEFDSFRSLFGGRDVRSLSTELMHLTQNQTARIEYTDQASRTIVNQYGNMLGIRENLRLQKRVSRLTGAIAILTVIVLAVSIMTTIPWVKEWVASWHERSVVTSMESE